MIPVCTPSSSVDILCSDPSEHNVSRMVFGLTLTHLNHTSGAANKYVTSQCVDIGANALAVIPKKNRRHDTFLYRIPDHAVFYFLSFVCFGSSVFMLTVVSAELVSQYFDVRISLCCFHTCGTLNSRHTMRFQTVHPQNSSGFVFKFAFETVVL